jgi:hypothetical protein
VAAPPPDSLFWVLSCSDTSSDSYKIKLSEIIKELSSKNS